ncbi:MAG TPA: proton-conducting membrane transporter [Deltaproteobacteria bacterium]|nr:MAG: proton-conducting membrane transporter [Deltaproteobacteria bacterium]HDM32644.1 proton-conducting membrane transporter [Deltaproteobacteria bacterium]
MKFAEFIVSPILAFIIGVFLMGLSRRIMARIHRRYGPPLMQPVIDMIKLFSQKTISHGPIFDAGVILSLAGTIVLVLFIPFGGMCPLRTSGGLLVILYIMLFAPLGLALSGGEGANPNISIGISRKFILSLGYEVPFILIMLSVMTYYHTISAVDVVKAQSAFHWAIFSVPLFLPGLAYILIIPAMLGIRPFDLASAPQEISSGPMAEYGGKYLALAEIEHAFAIFITIGLFVDMFLGGSSNVFYFFLKVLVVFVIGLLINAVFPRFRTEQAVKFLWKWPSVMALAGLIIVLAI